MLLCPGEKPLQRPPALLREGRARVPVFHEAEPLEALKRDPIQVLNVQLAFGEAFQRELFGRAEAEGLSFHRGDLSGDSPARTVAAWRSAPEHVAHLSLERAS